MAVMQTRPTWKECLTVLPSEVTGKWAALLGQESEGLLAVMHQWRKRLSEGTTGWSEWEQKAMEFLVWKVGEEGLPDSRVSEGASRSKLSPVRLRVGLSLLVGRGVVFRLRSPGGERVFWCPREVREAYLAGTVHPRPLSGRDVRGDNQWSGVWDQLFLFLIMIDREGLPLTKDRRLPRKIERKWAAEMELDSDGLQGSYWDVGDGEAAFPLLLELAERLRLIEFEAGLAKLCRPAVARWLLQSWSVRLDELLLQVEQALLSRHPRHHSLWWWLRQQNDENWHEWGETVSAAWQDLSVNGGSLFVQGEIADVLKQWMAALTWMGWIDQVRENGKTWWRWAPRVLLLKRESTAWKGRVQPDGEILLPPGTALDRRWRLAQFADYMGGDPLVHYLLLPQTVKRGAQQGLSAAEMIADLEELTRRPLSPTIRDLIQEWAEPYGARMEMVWLAELDEEELADDWIQCLRNHSDWGRAVGRRMFALQEEGAKAFQRWLEERAIPLIWEREQTVVWWNQLEKIKSEEKEEEPRPGWLVEQPDSRPETAVPGWSSLPRVWTDSLRPYHESTLREVFRQATKLELDVSWSGPDGRVRRITPTSVFAEGQEWMVRGRGEDGKECSIPLSKMSQVGILAPWGNLTNTL